MFNHYGKHKKKKVVKNQNYENYWKLTLAFTGYFKCKFIRILSIIVDHIDNYNLGNKTINEVSTVGNTGKRKLKENVVHTNELINKIELVSPTNDTTGATTRKKINTFIKLGFIKPFYLGYVHAAKKYTDNKSKNTLRRLFSDTVYKYSSFNSSQTNDETDINQINFLIQTILNRNENNRKLSSDELIGLMNMDIRGKNYANEEDIYTNKQWSKMTDFVSRKYNQIGYLKSILSNLSMFKVIGTKSNFGLYIDNNDLINIPNTEYKRDPYRFALMKKAVYEQSYLYYNKKICWLTKGEPEGLVVSHLYGSAEALKNWDIDEAYDPDNALLLDPGSPDKYIDNRKMTIRDDGKPVYGPEVKEYFLNQSIKYNYHIDKKILNANRMKYIHFHQKQFIKKYPKLKEKVIL